MLPVAILAGGLSTRLANLTEKIPKSLIEINGKPFLDWQLDLLEKSGVTHVVYCLSHKANMIQDYLVQRNTHINIEFSFDGKSQLGTGGAVIKARSILGKNFFVLYGDSYLPINYQEVNNFFLSQEAPSLMTIIKNVSKQEPSNVIFENDGIKLYDKFNYSTEMNYIDYGLSVFNEKAFMKFPQNENVDLSTIQHQLSKEGSLAGYEVNKRYYEVGSVKGIMDFKEFTRGF